MNDYTNAVLNIIKMD